MKYNSIRYEDENFRIRVSADSESYIDKVDDFSKAFRKVIENHEQLLESDTEKKQDGRWFGTTN